MKKFLSLILILSITSVSAVFAEYASKAGENKTGKMELSQQQQQDERPQCLVCGRRMSQTLVNQRDYSRKCKACKGTGKLDDGRGNKSKCGYCDGTGHPVKQVWVWKCPHCGK